MKKFNVLALMLAIVLLLGSLCGCSQSAPRQSAPAKVSEATAAPVAESAAPSETPPATPSPSAEVTLADENVEISLGSWGFKQDWIPVIQRELNKKYPNITITYEAMEYADYVNKLKINLVSGTGWDVFVLQPGALLDASKEYCLPLLDRIEKEWGPQWKDQFVDGSLDPILAADPNVLGFPDVMSYAGMLFFNKTVLKNHGLDAFPATYEELKNYVQTLRSGNELPIIIGGKDTWIIIDLFTVIANDIAPGKIYEADAGTIAWTDPGIVAALKAWKQLFPDGILQDGCLGIPQYPTAAELYWRNRQGSALVDGDWTLGIFTNPEWKDDTNVDEYGLAAFPDMNGDGQPCAISYSPGSIYCINKNIDAAKQEAAWQFIKWYATEEGMQVMNSPEIGMAYNPAFKAVVITRNSDSANFINCANDLAGLSKRVGGARELNNADVKNALGEVLQELGTGLSAQEAAQKLQDASGQ